MNGRSSIGRSPVARSGWHLSASAWGVTCATAFLIPIAVVLGKAEITILAFSAISVLGICALLTALPKPDLTVTRSGPNRGSVGVPMRIKTLFGTTRTPISGYFVFTESTSGEEPENLAIAAKQREQPLVLTSAATPTRRGYYQLPSATLTFTDPFRLTHRTVDCLDDHQIIVHPRTVPIPDLLASVGQSRRGPRTGGDGEQLGMDGEFFGLREYLPGDDVRRISWTATARTGQPQIRQFHENDMCDYVLALDNRAAIHSLQSLDRAVTIAASLVRGWLSSGARIRVLSSGGYDSGIVDAASLEPVLDFLALCRLHGTDTSSTSESDPRDDQVDVVCGATSTNSIFRSGSVYLTTRALALPPANTIDVSSVFSNLSNRNDGALGDPQSGSPSDPVASV